MCATGADDGAAKLWDAVGAIVEDARGPRRRRLRGTRRATSCCGACDGTLWMWPATSGACMRVFAGHDGAVLWGVYGDAKRFRVGGRFFRVWNPRKGPRNTFLPHKGVHGRRRHDPRSRVVHRLPPVGSRGSSGVEDGCAVVVHCSSKK